MSAKLSTHRRFLIALSQKPKLIKIATPAQLAAVIEVLHNIHRIALSAKEKRAIAKVLPIVKQIAKSRRVNEARSQLIQHGGAILPALIPAALALLLNAL